MPVILRWEHHALWLGPAIEDETRVLPLLKPLACEQMDPYEVSRLVNVPRYHSPTYVQPVALTCAMDSDCTLEHWRQR